MCDGSAMCAVQRFMQSQMNNDYCFCCALPRGRKRFRDAANVYLFNYCPFFMASLRHKFHGSAYSTRACASREGLKSARSRKIAKTEKLNVEHEFWINSPQLLRLPPTLHSFFPEKWGTIAGKIYSIALRYRTRLFAKERASWFMFAE